MSIQVKEYIEFENNCGLFDDEINGFKYLQYIRFFLYRIINDMKEENYTKKSLFSYGLSLVKRIGYSYRSSPYRHKENIDCLCICSPRKSFINGEYLDLFTKDAYDYVSKNYKSLIVDYDERFLSNNPYYDYSLVGMVDFINVKRALLKIFILNKDTSDKINEKSREIVNLLFKNFDIETDQEDVYKKVHSLISNYYVYYKAAKPVFQKFFKKKNIKFVSLVCHYFPLEMVIFEVANENNIETLEIQHGIMGEGHVAYNYYHDSPVFFPKNLLLFSEYWKKTTLFPANCNLFITGFPFLEKYRKQHENAISKKDTILFISQGKDSEGLYEFANKVFDYFKKNNKDIEILYKLHPKENPNDYGFDANIKIIEGKNNIYDLLLISRMQIGVFSTAIYEGLAFGLKTLIYKINDSANRMKYLVENDYAEYIKDPAQVFEAYYSDTNTKNVDSFYADDSYNKTIKAFTEIIDKRLKG